MQFSAVTSLPQLSGQLTYQLTRPIAAGGMGCVYEAEQRGPGGFHKRVAIKIIREEYSNLPEFRQNFIGEARLVADLIHSNIVQTYHLDASEDRYYMVLEYVDGINLEDFLLQHRALGIEIPLDLACFIVSRVCRGLAYAHGKRDQEGKPLGIVHRDVNPRNILISREGEVKLSDFGIAKALNLMYNHEGEVIAGKDEYLSPEQARREVTDARADIFSCGIVLAEMVLGYQPFAAETPVETRRQITDGPLPDFREARRLIDDRLVQILRRCLRKERSQRHQTAQELFNALELHLYSDGYGPTSDKLAAYIQALFANGKAYLDEAPRRETAPAGQLP